MRALDGVDLEVQEGTVLGLLGPNGAGKTTTVRILSTLLRADGGSARVAGLDIARDAQAVRKLIGLSGQYAAVDENLTGRENLWMFGRLYQLSSAEAKQRASELLTSFDLEGAADRVTKTYSGGMRRRLDLASALIGRPQLLFLDEPTTGLDPRSRLGMWEVIRNQVRQGTTLLLTTQYLEEADELADEIAVVDAGKIIARGTADELKSQVGGERIEVVLHDRSLLGQVAEMLAPDGTATVDEHSRRVTIAAEGGAQQLVEVVRSLGEEHIVIDDVGLRRPTLDDVFLTLTGHAAEADRRRRRRARGRREEEAMSALRLAVADGLIISWRNLKRVPADPGARDLRDSPVDHVRAAVRVRLRRRDPASRRRLLPRVPDAGDLRPDARIRIDHDGDRSRGRHDQGPDRPVPVAADGPLGRAQRPHLRRHPLQHRHPDRADGCRGSPSAGG